MKPRVSVSDGVLRRAYASANWRHARAAKARRDPLCEECREYREYRPVCEVHHMWPLRNGGSLLHADNLVSLCAPCHRRYDRREEQWRAGQPGAYGADINGNPQDDPPGVKREDNPNELALWKAWERKEARANGS